MLKTVTAGTPTTYETPTTVVSPRADGILTEAGPSNSRNANSSMNDKKNIRDVTPEYY
jgi:hypothetical protein